MKNKQGFTLLEILLVIAMIGILAAIVLIAINPQRQLAQTRNATRQSDTNAISKALEQYLIDTGDYPTSLTTDYQEICGEGEPDCTGFLDLSVLTPTYLAGIPEEPGNSTAGSGYQAAIDANGKISVRTPNGESVDGSGDPLTIGVNVIPESGGSGPATPGDIWAWGSNDSGRFGNGNDTNNTLAALANADGDWIDIETGIAFGIGLKSDGTIWSWGDNASEQLGQGDTTDRFSPTQIGTDTDWESITAGAAHAAAIKTDGTLWTWGEGSQYRLGNGATNDVGTPTQIGTDTDWSGVFSDTGSIHTLAQKDDGTLWGWGDNFNGQIGLGSSGNDIQTPTQVGSDTDWAEIDLGDNFTTALKDDGTIWAWGVNTWGQLGDGTDNNRSTPNQIGTDTDWLTISAGATQTLALKEAGGSLWAWGGNLEGTFGNGSSSFTDQTTPVLITQAGSNWSDIDTSTYHTLALQDDGSLWSWGANYFGELGIGNTSSEFLPQSVGGAATDWIEIEAGQLHSNALREQ